MITRCADTGRVPPAKGVIVSAAALPAGLRTVKIELTDVVVIEASHKWVLSVYKYLLCGFGESPLHYMSIFVELI